MEAVIAGLEDPDAVIASTVDVDAVIAARDVEAITVAAVQGQAHSAPAPRLPPVVVGTCAAKAKGHRASR